MSCDRTIQIHRYYDRQLSAAERAEAEAHVEVCFECRQLLDELRRLSILLSRADAAVMPDGMISRLQRVREERAVLRIAGWMTATAAGILIGAVLTWPGSRADNNTWPAVWESAAVSGLVEVNDHPNADLLVMAQWMADELSATQNGDLR